MLYGKRVAIVMPAYNAERTLPQTYREIPKDIVDDIILVDDASTDQTVVLARQLGIQHILVHERNQGYGANQKTCYRYALSLGADIIIMLHPDYQYSPRLIPAMASIIALDVYPVVLGSRILGGRALQGGMPLYKYVANRVLTAIQNIATGAKLSEYHTGYRAYARYVLEQIPFEQNSDDFIFDNQILCQILWAGFPIAEVTCPTRYFPEASSINFWRSIRYGLGCVKNSLLYLLARSGIYVTPWLKAVPRNPAQGTSPTPSGFSALNQKTEDNDAHHTD